MQTIPHRELRNNSSKVLEEVRQGAVIAVTNHGEVSAILVPPTTSRYELLRLAGHIQPATSTDSFLGREPQESAISSAEILDDLRAE